jgi:hypothetical protein
MPWLLVVGGQEQGSRLCVRDEGRIACCPAYYRRPLVSVGGDVKCSTWPAGMQILPAFRPHSITADTHPGASHEGAPTYPMDALPRRNSLIAVAAGKPHGDYRVCVKWEEVKAALAKQAPERSRKSVATGQPASPKAKRAGPTSRQRDLGKGWNHIVRGGLSSRLLRLLPTTHTLIPSSTGHEGARAAYSDRHQGDGQA